MALIRGTNGKCPCPICLVPKTEQHDLGKTFRERTAYQSQTVVEHAMHLSREKAEKHLKKNGLRPIRVREMVLLLLFLCDQYVIRMHSGLLTTRIRIAYCLSIHCILMTQVSMVDICGQR
jgi:hypothetical protein